MRTLATVVLILLVGLLLGLFLTRSRSVLFAFREPGDPLEEPFWTIFHPFRDRAPERAAEAILHDLKRGDYREALSRIHMSDTIKAEIQSEEVEFKLRSWELMNRQDSPGEVRLFYFTARDESSELHSPLWITVTQSELHNGWQVTNFEAWY